jgi:hypothetical protein
MNICFLYFISADTCLLVCEALVMIQGIHAVLGTMMKWCVNDNIKDVFVLEGFHVQGIPASNRQIGLLIARNRIKYKKLAVNLMNSKSIIVIKDYKRILL